MCHALLQLETDAGDVLNECITAVRKGGRISVIGAYIGYVNHFNIGAFMEKQVGLECPCKVVWKRRRQLCMPCTAARHGALCCKSVGVQGSHRSVWFSFMTLRFSTMRTDCSLPACTSTAHHAWRPDACPGA